MLPAKACKLIATLSCTCLLQACVTVIVESGNTETDDLAAVTRDAIGLAQRLGSDQVLVVYDIDNTLLAMEQGLGADQWYEWQKELSHREPCHEAVVADRLAVQGALFFASAMRPTQADAPDQVRRVQDAGIPVVVITSRGMEFRLQTFRELRRNGYDFRRSAIGPETGWPEPFTPEKASRPTRYEDGVYMTAGQHKGHMLEALLQRSGLPLPKAIVMVDDNQDNLDAVSESFLGRDIAVRTWRYSGEDQNVAAFDPDLSHRQWQRLLPAMETIESVFGPDNFDLPPDNRPAGCDSG